MGDYEGGGPASARSSARLVRRAVAFMSRLQPGPREGLAAARRGVAVRGGQSARLARSGPSLDSSVRPALDREADYDYE